MALITLKNGMELKNAFNGSSIYQCTACVSGKFIAK